MSQPIRLGDLLVRAGVVSEFDVQRALNEQKRWGGRLGTTLVRMGVLTEDLLVKALAKQLDMPRANLDAISLPPELRARLDRTFCERNTLVPLAVDQAQGRLLVAVSDPLGSTAPDEPLRQRCGAERPRAESGVDPALDAEHLDAAAERLDAAAERLAVLHAAHHGGRDVDAARPGARRSRAEAAGAQ
jgi:hypothetical protein